MSHRNVSRLSQRACWGRTPPCLPQVSTTVRICLRPRPATNPGQARPGRGLRACSASFAPAANQTRLGFRGNRQSAPHRTSTSKVVQSSTGKACFRRLYIVEVSWRPLTSGCHRPDNMVEKKQGSRNTRRKGKVSFAGPPHGTGLATTLVGGLDRERRMAAKSLDWHHDVAR